MKVLIMQLASTTIMDLVAYGGAAIGIAIAVLDVVNMGLSPFGALFLILVSVDFFLPLRAFGSAFHIAMNGASAGSKILSLLEQPDPVWGKDKVTDTQLSLENLMFSYDGKRDVLKNINMTFPKTGMTAIVGESGWGKDKVTDTQLSLENLMFSYDGKRDVLKNINMTFPKTGMTAIVGESGCGKSSVVNMIYAELRPKYGSVTAGGIAIEKFQREDYYSHIAIVSYNTYIFNETVRSNFMLAKRNVTDEEIYEALEKVNIADFIRNNGGLDKMITEDGANISGGQKQRLALAVNLVAGKEIYVFDEATSNIDIESETIIMKNIKELSKSKSVIVISHRLANIVNAKEIYVFDEATSNIDIESETIIMKNIKELSKSKSVIVISHRLANIVNADFIYYMESGEVKESGTHEELIEKQGGYARLYKAQKELEEGYIDYSDLKVKEAGC